MAVQERHSSQPASFMRATITTLARKAGGSNTTGNNHHNNNNDNHHHHNSSLTNENSQNSLLAKQSIPLTAHLPQNRSAAATAPLRSSSTPLRTPLSARDHNASIMFRPAHKGTPLGSKSGNATSSPTLAMPPDKHNVSSHTRPLMPTLSAVAAKAVVKPPLTPRVACANTTSPATISKRPRPENAALHAAPHNPNYTASTLAHNVTPRSIKRNSRIDSPSGTPAASPLGPPPGEPRLTTYTGPAILGASHGQRPLAFSPPTSDIGSHASPLHDGNDSKFFFASDAKTVAQPVKQSRPQLQSKPSTFMYANGDNIHAPATPAPSVRAHHSDDAGLSKFCRADGTSDSRSQNGYFPAAPSNIGTPTPRLAQSPIITTPSQRPLSPLKSMPSAPNLRPAKSVVSTSQHSPRPTALRQGQSAQDVNATRRVSIELPQRPLTQSVVPTLNSEKRRRPSGIAATVAFLPTLPASPLLSPASVASPSALLASPDGFSDSGTHESPSLRRLSFSSVASHAPSATSPPPAGSSLEQMNELAAVARRERKVLDLEITNSSLTSVNRTLERQLRKQTAELRRYRRLSRSGRLSIAVSGRPSTASTLASENGTLSDMEELTESEDGSDEDSEGDDASDVESEGLAEGTLSPGAQAKSDARHRKKDERRLQQDLSRHQQVLIDSQKMNQSIRRCLTWTEELIRDGRRALMYSVKVSDVQLGGHVLDMDAVAGEEEEEVDEECARGHQDEDGHDEPENHDHDVIHNPHDTDGNVRIKTRHGLPASPRGWQAWSGTPRAEPGDPGGIDAGFNRRNFSHLTEELSGIADHFEGLPDA